MKTEAYESLVDLIEKTNKFIKICNHDICIINKISQEHLIEIRRYYSKIKLNPNWPIVVPDLLTLTLAAVSSLISLYSLREYDVIPRFMQPGKMIHHLREMMKLISNLDPETVRNDKE